MRFSLRRHWLLLLAMIPIGFALVSVASALMFTAPKASHVGTPPAGLAQTLVDITFTATDGTRLSGWFGATGDGRRGVILLHGYHDDRTQVIDRAAFLLARGYSVLLYDARGCGESQGDLVSVGYYETSDLLGAVEYMRTKGVQRIACLGVSQGGATILLASGRLEGVDCVIVESTYDRIENAIDRRFRHYLMLPGALAGSLMVPIAESRIGVSISQISPIDSIVALRVPILVISGDSDTRTTAADTRSLFAKAPQPKDLWMIPGADHEDLFAYTPEEYMRRVLDFLEVHMQESARDSVR